MFKDGREQTVVDHILARADELRGRPEAILAAIDTWSETNKMLMTVGSSPNRGDKVLDIIHETRPNTMVEFGGYIGYSTIKFANAVRASGGKRYISLKGNKDYAGLARSLVTLAGLDQFVNIMIGSVSASLPKLSAWNFDVQVFFIDHDEGLYASDLKLAEGMGLVQKGSWVLADNIIGDRTQD